MIFKPVRTPCIGICSTGIGDDVCRGCKRFSHEVIDWNAYSQEQRRAIANRLDSFLAQVVANYIEIFDQKRLLQQLTHQQVRFNEDQQPHCWVFDLLKAGASQIEAGDYGIRIKPHHSNLDLTALKQKIDDDFLVLSQAHFERYFASVGSSESQTGDIESQAK